MKKKSKEVAEGDYTHLLERLEAFEERCGVRLEGLSAIVDSDEGYIWVRGELHARDEHQLKRTVVLVGTCYDSSSRVLNTFEEHFDSETFYGFEVFQRLLKFNPAEVVKIRIYPKLA